MLRHHVSRDPLAAGAIEVLAVGSSLNGTEGGNAVANHFIWHSDGNAFLNRGVRVEGCLDLSQLDSVAATLDEVVAAPDEAVLGYR